MSASLYLSAISDGLTITASEGVLFVRSSGCDIFGMVSTPKALDDMQAAIDRAREQLVIREKAAVARAVSA